MHLFLVILLLAATYFFMRSFTSQTGSEEQSKVSTLFSIEPQQTGVATIDEVFITDPQAEYLYHAQIDSSAVTPEGLGEIHYSQFFSEVSVSYEPDAFEVASVELENNQNNAFYAEDESYLEHIYPLFPRDLVARITSSDDRSLLYVGDDWFIELHTDSTIQYVCFVYKQLIRDRVTTMKVWAKDDFYTVSEMHNTFNQLVNKYEDLPYHRFSGARRV